MYLKNMDANIQKNWEIIIEKSGIPVTFEKLENMAISVSQFSVIPFI